jgi:hypothetical protein
MLRCMCFPALEEYGIPVQISVKIRNLLALGDGLDRAIDSLMALNLNRTRLVGIRA